MNRLKNERFIAFPHFCQIPAASCLSIAALLTLVSCTPTNTADTESPSDSFRTQEYRTSSGLDQIQAAEGYYSLQGPEGGQGVAIAILDDGVDENHPDIAPNLLNSFFYNSAINVDSQHGTAVAGIAAGAKNNSGIQGVAYNADILAFQVGDQDPANPSSIEFDDDAITQAIVDAPGLGASIINMSFGRELTGDVILPDGSPRPYPDPLPQAILVAMRSAAAQGSLMVVSAGNSRDNLPDINLPPTSLIGPDHPAKLAADPLVAQGAIVAVAVDSANQLASFSNMCLGVETRCMAAPGVNFVGAIPGGISGIGGGTSYSAPMISGAAAVVQAAFGVTPQEAGNRLLSTATDIGTAGIDSIYGQGLLNLENALAPQGQLMVATSNSLNGPKIALSQSSLSLGSSFALGGYGAALLSEAVTLDDDNFPFGVDLGRSAAVQSRATGLAAFIGSSDRKSVTSAMDMGVYRLSVARDAERDDPYRVEFAASDTALEAEVEQPRIWMQSGLRDGVDLFVGFNGSSHTDAGLVHSLPEGGDFFQPSAFLAPFDQLSGEQNGGGTRMALGAAIDLSVSAFTSADGDQPRRTMMQKVELTHKTLGDIELRLGYGFMQEEGGFLGSETGGAFGASSGGKSQYVGLSILAPLTDKVSLFGAYTRGNTDASGGSNSLLSNYATIRSEAFGAGLVMRNLAKEDDGLSLVVGQPLRVTEGSAEVTVPVGRTEDGRVQQKSGTLDLAPAGREIAIEAVYEVALNHPDQSLTAGSFLRLNPDHDPNAAPDVGIGLTYKFRF